MATPGFRCVGAPPSPIGHEGDGLDDDVEHAGCYSAPDLEAIRQHALRRFVTIVPEIDLPGHAQAVIAAYPDLGNGDEPLEVWARWGSVSTYSMSGSVP